MQTISLVRYKKDLRVDDHQPLFDALTSNTNVIAFYCFEPEIISQRDYSDFHHVSIIQSLHDLKAIYDTTAVPLLIFRSSIEEALKLLGQYYSIQSIYSHEETGNRASYQRDIRLGKYLAGCNIPRYESPTNCVVRRLRTRDERAAKRKERMSKPIVLSYEALVQHSTNATATLQLPIELERYREVPQGPAMTGYELQPAGLQYAKRYCESFLATRYQRYMYDIGKPHESRQSCSRLSVFLTYGNLSIKQVSHTANEQLAHLVHQRNSHEKKSEPYVFFNQRIKHMRAFISRLYWHCHFIQKLESAPRYEYENIHPYYDAIRTVPNQTLIEAWKAGQTGFPLIDAAMRCLKKTGWINFRLRATVVSFICNTCLQDRKEPAVYLASVFTDYEPGIHYTQIQMQAGTTGINQYRIYNPTKQLLDKDTNFSFIDKWVPELKHIPREYKAEPRKMETMSSGLLGQIPSLQVAKKYPSPIIDLTEANRHAKKVLRDLKKQEGFKQIAQEIYKKHGSRKKQPAKTVKRKKERGKKEAM